MTVYVIQTNQTSQATPVLRKGTIRIQSDVAVYWKVAENPQADATCALLRAGQSIDLRLPTKCNRIAVLAVTDSGTVSVQETSGGARASCSA